MHSSSKESEAGGHQGSFDDTDAAPVGLLALLQLMRDATDLPLVAAGGIANGRESPASSRRARRPLRWERPDADTGGRNQRAAPCGIRGAAPTALTRAFSGRRARGIVNRFMRDHDAAAPKAYPQVHYLPRRFAQPRAPPQTPMESTCGPGRRIRWPRRCQLQNSSHAGARRHNHPPERLSRAGPGRGGGAGAWWRALRV